MLTKTITRAQLDAELVVLQSIGRIYGDPNKTAAQKRKEARQLWRQHLKAAAVQ